MRRGRGGGVEVVGDGSVILRPEYIVVVFAGRGGF